MRPLDIVNQDDPLQVVLRAHLLLEETLMNLIESVLEFPDEIDLVQIPFSKRIDLAVAIGVLPRDMKPRFTKINQIRNRFAHKLHSEITEDDIKAIWDSLIKYDRDALEVTSFHEKSIVGKFGGFILITQYRLKQRHSFLSEPEVSSSGKLELGSDSI